MDDVMKSRCAWPETFILMAHLMAVTRSKDPARAVGTIVTNRDNRIMATGYNGLSPGQPDSKDFWTGPAREGCRHAEENAIDYLEENVAPVNRRNLNMYISHIPCGGCGDRIIAAKSFANVYYPKFVQLNYLRRGDKISEINAVENAFAQNGIVLHAVDVNLKTLAEISTAMTSLWITYASKGIGLDNAVQDLTCGAQPGMDALYPGK